MGTHICNAPKFCWECLQAELKKAQEERDHWKANHDSQVAKKRAAADFRDGFKQERNEAIERGKRCWKLLKAAISERERMVSESMALAAAWQQRAEKAEQQLKQYQAEVQAEALLRGK